MIRQNLHTHSQFDDGCDSMEDMVRAAIDAGMTSLGFSIHSPLPFPAQWTIREGRMPEYVREVRRIREAYRGRIAVYCGVEWDELSDIDLDAFDYVIGSVHHIIAGGEICCMDKDPEETARYLDELFNGNPDEAAEAYYARIATLARIGEVDIVGHFDLPTKFDDTHGFYNPDSPRCRAAALAALDALTAAGKIFEINTGAVARGYKQSAYPSRGLLDAIRERGGRITVSSDAHRAADIAFGFAEAEKLARDCGFTQIWQFDGDSFAPIALESA
jgi:histidinol-phosphatase (PHP family)